MLERENELSPSFPIEPTPTDSVTSWRKGSVLLARLCSATVLRSSGNVARDHLSSERTFLAYVRTSSVISITGVALVQLFTVASSESTASSTLTRIRRFARPLGATTIAFGLAILVFGLHRYFVIQNSLMKGVFPAARFVPAGITVILTILVIVVFVVILSD